MQKYKVLKGGLTCQAINPFDGNYSPEQYDDFDRANPILPLTHPQDEGIEVDGGLVWQYHNSQRGGWLTCEREPSVIGKARNNCRQALQPITTNSKEEKPKIDIYGSYENTQPLKKSPLPIASASIETVEQAAERQYQLLNGESLTKITSHVYNTHMFALREAFKLGAHWQSQTTQQPLIELLEKRINKLIEMQERSAVKYKACFGDKNPGGEQIYEYFALQLKELLKP